MMGDLVVVEEVLIGRGWSGGIVELAHFEEM